MVMHFMEVTKTEKEYPSGKHSNYENNAQLLYLPYFVKDALHVLSH